LKKIQYISNVKNTFSKNDNDNLDIVFICFPRQS